MAFRFQGRAELRQEWQSESRCAVLFMTPNCTTLRIHPVEDAAINPLVARIRVKSFRSGFPSCHVATILYVNVSSH